MNLWTMIFLTVTVIFLAEVAKTYLNQKPPKDVSAKLEDLDRRCQKLEEHSRCMEKRLKNVETIATSPDFHLEREFEKFPGN